jgi:hypothetical protein
VPQQQVLRDQVTASAAGGADRREEQGKQLEHGTIMAPLFTRRHPHRFAAHSPR